MDQIVVADADVVQIAPFNLDFDRVITAIDGNTITLDAPIANAIESRWGGGRGHSSHDPDRIEQVGVEQLRVVVEFNPAVTAVKQRRHVLCRRGPCRDIRRARQRQERLGARSDEPTPGACAVERAAQREVGDGPGLRRH